MCHLKKNYQRIWLLLILVFLLTACNNPAPIPQNTPFTTGCSESDLKDDINQANIDAGPDVINLDPNCVYTLRTVAESRVFHNQTIHSGLPNIVSEITINGNNAVIDIQSDISEPSFGHFFVERDGDLEIYDLTLENGARPVGGAIVVYKGDFFASNTNFLNNFAYKEDENAVGRGGAIYNESGNIRIIANSLFQGNLAGHSNDSFINLGGAIYSKNGSLLVSSSIFDTNAATGNGGAIYTEKNISDESGGWITIDGSSFIDNSASSDGGAIYLINEMISVIITTSDFSENRADGSGGAIFSEASDLTANFDTFGSNTSALGGAIYSKRLSEGSLSSLKIKHSEFNRNAASEIGGAIFSENSDVTLKSGDFKDNTADSCGAFRNGGSPDLDILAGDLEIVPRVSSSTKITDTFFYRNFATLSNGGAICHLMGDVTMQGTRLSSNQAEEFGGAMLISDEIEISDMSMMFNIARNGAGAAIGYPWPGGSWVNPSYMTFVTNISDADIFMNQASNQGGGIWMSNGGRVSIDHSAIHINSSLSAGGGIYQLTGGLYISNSTFSGNTAYNGGGLYNDGTKDSLILEIRHSTFANNTATEDPTGGAPLDRLGGGGLNLGGIVNIYNSLVTQNSNKDCDLNQTMTYTKSGNVDFDGTCGFSITETNPRLGPLQYNGGTNGTHALRPDSPLIDILPDCALLVDDQRGISRPQGSNCDPGAYEFYPDDPRLTPPPPPAPPPPMPDVPPDDSSDNCPPFEDLDISVVLLNVPANTLVLPLYFRFPGSVPGQDEAEFKAHLGNLESYKCDQQGFEDRLYCMFNLTPDMPGLALDLLLYKDDCEDPSYTLPNVTIPEIKESIPDPKLQCSKDLNKDACEAAGGTLINKDTPSQSCDCP